MTLIQYVCMIINNHFSLSSQEMKALLANLEHANKLAANLRERSKEIVRILGEEITAEESQMTKREED